MRKLRTLTAWAVVDTTETHVIPITCVPVKTGIPKYETDVWTIFTSKNDAEHAIKKQNRVPKAHLAVVEVAITGVMPASVAPMFRYSLNASKKRKAVKKK